MWGGESLLNGSGTGASPVNHAQDARATLSLGMGLIIDLD